jgi:hypothetical protein
MRVVSLFGIEPGSPPIQIGKNGQQWHQRKCRLNLRFAKKFEPTVPVDITEFGSPVFAARLE